MSGQSLNPLDATTQYLFSTVRVETVNPDGSRGSGTAFFFEDHTASPVSDYLITNRHVIAGAAGVRLRFHTALSGREPWVSLGSTAWLDIAEPERVWSNHPDPRVDLCALPVERLKSLAGGDLGALFYRGMRSDGVPKPEEAARYPAVLQVAMIGYPIGLWDEQNNLPVVRRGTTASHPAVDFNGEPCVLVDMACFPGSSGSPVVFMDRQYFASTHRFLGVLYAGPQFSSEGQIVIREIPTRTQAVAIHEQMVHLGYVIKSREVLALARSLAQSE